MNKHWVRAAAAAILILIIAACTAPGGPPGGDSGSQLTRTATVDRGRIEVQVSGTGQLEASAEASLGFATTGNVGAIEVEVGDAVEAGEELMRLDPTTTDVNIASAEAELIQAEQQLEDLQDPNTWQLQLAEARKSLAQAEDALEDAEYLRRVRQEGNRASESTIDAAEAKLIIAEDQVDRAKDKYDQFSGRDRDDTTRAVALRELANAREARDAALRSLNWLKGRPTEIEQAQLDADVAVAEAQVANAQEDVETYKLGPDPDELAAAEARVEAARARVDQAVLTAPFDGTVLAVYYRVGDKVEPGQPAIVVADISHLYVETPIDELDVANVEIGQPVTLTLDALDEVVMRGEVAEVDLSPLPASATTEYPVIATLTDVDDRARVGMTAAVDILVATKEDALIIPNWALRFDSETGQVYVNVLADDEPERRNVVLGLRNESFSEVVEGLKEGETVGVAPESPSFNGPFGGGG